MVRGLRGEVVRIGRFASRRMTVSELRPPVPISAPPNFERLPDH